MPVVRLDGSGEAIEVGKGANLRRSLLLHGKNPHRGVFRLVGCLGLGLCGSCQVRATQGADNLSAPSAMERLNWRRPLSRGRRLACQTRVFGDCTIALD
jgi:ferredoxin